MPEVPEQMELGTGNPQQAAPPRDPLDVHGNNPPVAESPDAVEPAEHAPARERCEWKRYELGLLLQWATAGDPWLQISAALKRTPRGCERAFRRLLTGEKVCPADPELQQLLAEAKRKHCAALAAKAEHPASATESGDGARLNKQLDSFWLVGHRLGDLLEQLGRIDEILLFVLAHGVSVGEFPAETLRLVRSLDDADLIAISQVASTIALSPGYHPEYTIAGDDDPSAPVIAEGGQELGAPLPLVLNGPVGVFVSGLTEESFDGPRLE